MREGGGGMGLGVGGVGKMNQQRPRAVQRGGVPRLMRGEETTAGIAVGIPDPSLPGAASRFGEGPQSHRASEGG